MEQLFFGGVLSLRAGQIAADDEFFVSQYASNFINATFGWPAILSADLPSGGPAYPLATPGARLKYAVSNQLSVQGAVFNGDPAGAGSGDPQARDPSGTSFRVNDGALAILEASFATNQDIPSAGLPATYKLGVWYHSGSFSDQRFDNSGQSLAAPTSTGVAELHSGDYGVYGVVDRMLWHKDGTADQGLGAFLRLGAAPPDRNLVSFYGDIGLSLKGPFAARGDDVVGIALAEARISEAAHALDADMQRLAGSANPIRDGETSIEVTYRYQASLWWALQPDLQFVIHPGGGAAPLGNPSSPSRISDAVIFGIRSAIVF